MESIFDQFISAVFTDAFQTAWRYLYLSSFVWLPILLIVGLWRLWMTYVQMKFIEEQGSVLLEIKLPREVNKTPVAMELVLTQMWQSGAATPIETYLGGKLRPWYSLELVSIGGQIHFYIWCQPKFRGMVEAQLYAQYPGVEVFEAEDYTPAVYNDPENLPLWGTQWKLVKPDAYPIKTYVDYGLDKEGVKEEFKSDPMTSMLEYLGSLRPGEQAWIQILIQAHKKEGFKEGRFIKKPDWTDEARKEIEKIREESIQKLEADDNSIRFPNVTEGQKNKMSAIERSLSKLPFETMIRSFYIGTKDAFNPANIPGLIGTTRQYNSNELNAFKLGWFTDFDYPWQDFRRIRRNKRERLLLEAYKLRSFFNPPYKEFNGKAFILTTEEVATLFHLPGQVASTPSIPRVASKKGEAPANIPL